jgi:hypothetical protein
MGVRPLMGSAGDTYDHAMPETFFATLECELIDRHVWKYSAQMCFRVLGDHGLSSSEIRTSCSNLPKHRVTSGGILTSYAGFPQLIANALRNAVYSASFSLM